MKTQRIKKLKQPFVGQLVKELRQLLNLTQEELATSLGVSFSTISRWERGVASPSPVASKLIETKLTELGERGEKLRKYLGEQATVQHLIDFGDASVFEAIAYPSIIQVSKAKPENHQTLILNWDKEQPLNEFANVFKTQSFHVAQKQLTSDGWRLESPEVLRLLDKLRNAGTPLGEYVNGRFYYGIKTGFNEAFVVDRATRDRLIAEHPSSAEVLKPFLRGRDVKRWCVNNPDLWLIFTRRGININDYPAIHDYLLQYKKRLTPGIKGGRKAGNYEWYEIQDNVAYWESFERPKIAYPNICKRNEFTLDINNYYINQKAFIIASDSKYLLGFLNSTITTWLFDKLLAKLQNGFYEPSGIFMKQFPIFKASKPDCLAIEALAQKCLDIKGRNVEEWEAEINDRVAHLYRLTAREIKLIESMGGA